MNIIRCSKGHFFDKDTFDECPHCRVIANRKGGSSGYGYGAFSRNTGLQDQNREAGSPKESVTGKIDVGDPSDEPVTGKIEYNGSLEEPVTGKIDYSDSSDDPVTGKIDYSGSSEESVTGKIDYNGSYHESATGRKDYGDSSDEAVTEKKDHKDGPAKAVEGDLTEGTSHKVLADEIPDDRPSYDKTSHTQESMESEHTFRIEALDQDSFVEFASSFLGRKVEDKEVSPGQADPEPLYEEVAEEDRSQETSLTDTEGEADQKEAQKEAEPVQDLGDLPVGWLVCVKGPEAGAVYILREGKNSIGRARTMTVSLPGDTSLSNLNHAFLEYDAGRMQFYALPGTSRGLCYVSDQLVLIRTPVNNYERISLGESELMLVQLCGDHFNWSLSFR